MESISKRLDDRVLVVDRKVNVEKNKTTLW